MPASKLTYRARGLPLPSLCNVDNVKRLLEHVLSPASQTTNHGDPPAVIHTIRSHSTSARLRGVVTFNLDTTVPSCLAEDGNVPEHGQWSFEVPGDVLAGYLNAPDDEHQRRSSASRNNGIRITVDTHFLGFTILSWPPNHDVDIIAIPGLGSGHAFGSFVHRERNCDYMWLVDELPVEFRSARIMTYGYNTGLVNSSSFQRLGDISSRFRDLLHELRTQTLINEDQKPRPIMFIAHSLGGLMIKQALVQMLDSDSASSISGEDATFSSVQMLMLFGTPSRGLKTEFVHSVVKDHLNDDFVRALDPNSQYLSYLNNNFKKVRRALPQLQIVSFYETQASPKAIFNSDTEAWEMKGELIVLVDIGSATADEKEGDDQHPIDGNHSSLVKLPPEDGTHDIIFKHIRNVAQRGSENHNRLVPTTSVHTSPISLPPNSHPLPVHNTTNSSASFGHTKVTGEPVHREIPPRYRTLDTSPAQSSSPRFASGVRNEDILTETPSRSEQTLDGTISGDSGSSPWIIDENKVVESPIVQPRNSRTFALSPRNTQECRQPSEIIKESTHSELQLPDPAIDTDSHAEHNQDIRNDISNSSAPLRHAVTASLKKYNTAVAKLKRDERNLPPRGKERIENAKKTRHINEAFLVLAVLGNYLSALDVVTPAQFQTTHAVCIQAFEKTGFQHISTKLSGLDIEVQYVIAAGLDFCAVCYPTRIYQGFGSSWFKNWNWGGLPDQDNRRRRSFSSILNINSTSEVQENQQTLDAFETVIRSLHNDSLQKLKFVIQDPELIAVGRTSSEKLGQRATKNEIEILSKFTKVLKRKGFPELKDDSQKVLSWGVPFATWDSRINCLRDHHSFEKTLKEEIDPGRLLHAFLCDDHLDLERPGLDPGTHALLLLPDSVPEHFARWLEGKSGMAHQLVPWEDFSVETPQASEKNIIPNHVALFDPKRRMEERLGYGKKMDQDTDEVLWPGLF